MEGTIIKQIFIILIQFIDYFFKERGTGELKVLKHTKNKTVRIVMRRDKTLKVCANHFIQPNYELKPVKYSERAYIYTSYADYADETPKKECFAIKFSNVESKFAGKVVGKLFVL